jgi:hypothetical protein
MSDHARSEQACPVCGAHALALDRPPEIDVMGVQSYSDMLGMGDLPNQGAVGIVCLDCGAHWRDKDAFDRGELDPDEDDGDDDGSWGGRDDGSGFGRDDDEALSERDAAGGADGPEDDGGEWTDEADDGSEWTDDS